MAKCNRCGKILDETELLIRKLSQCKYDKMYCPVCSSLKMEKEISEKIKNMPIGKGIKDKKR